MPRTVLNMPLVSVVTPVHNGEAYLAECIESVLAQTYDRWEYTIVNNCSTDRSFEVAQRYAEKDHRLRVCSTPQMLDAIASQNTAYQQVSPEAAYCKVVHADDWLFPECLTQMVEVAEAHPSVGIVGAYRLDGDHVGCDGLPYPSTVVSGRAICRSILLGGPGVFGSPTSILVRAEYIRRKRAFLDESDFHADTAACFEVLRDSDFGFVHQVLTYTRRHDGSQTSFAKRVNSYLAGGLRHLLTYGPIYLEPGEYKACLERTLRTYYRFLAQSVLEPGAQEAWAYHRKALSQLGYPLSWRAMTTMLRPYWGRAVREPLTAIRLACGLLPMLVHRGRTRS